jgi:hypothetical protein
MVLTIVVLSAAGSKNRNKVEARFLAKNSAMPSWQNLNNH